MPLVLRHQVRDNKKVMHLTVRPARIRWRQWLLLIIVVATLYVVIPQLNIFHNSWRILQRAEWPLALLAICFTALTYFAAAANYYLLAFRRLRYGRTVLMQLASTFANRLLPAGIGGMGANYAYLRKMRHSPAQAASAVAANNFLGLVGHLLLLGILLLIRPAIEFEELHVPMHVSFSWLEGFVVVSIVVAVVMGARLRHHVISSIRQTVQQLAVYRRRPLRLVTVLLVSICLTVCNISSFYGCLMALGISMSFLAVALVFTVGIGLGTVTPTPGGLGGTEVGLVAGLVAFNVTSADALAAVLLYRFISYWLPLIAGAGAFVVAVIFKSIIT